MAPAMEATEMKIVSGAPPRMYSPCSAMKGKSKRSMLTSQQREATDEHDPGDGEGRAEAQPVTCRGRGDLRHDGVGRHPLRDAALRAAQAIDGHGRNVSDRRGRADRRSPIVAGNGTTPRPSW